MDLLGYQHSAKTLPGTFLLPSESIFTDLYSDLNWSTLRIILPHNSASASRIYEYGNGTKVLRGYDVEAMRYLARAMKFKIE